MSKKRHPTMIRIEKLKAADEERRAANHAAGKGNFEQAQALYDIAHKLEAEARSI